MNNQIMRVIRALLTLLQIQQTAYVEDPVDTWQLRPATRGKSGGNDSPELATKLNYLIRSTSQYHTDVGMYSTISLRFPMMEGSFLSTYVRLETRTRSSPKAIPQTTSSVIDASYSASSNDSNSYPPCLTCNATTWVMSWQAFTPVQLLFLHLQLST